MVPLPHFRPIPLGRTRAPFSHLDWIFEVKCPLTQRQYTISLPRNIFLTNVRQRGWSNDAYNNLNLDDAAFERNGHGVGSIVRAKL